VVEHRRLEVAREGLLKMQLGKRTAAEAVQKSTVEFCERVLLAGPDGDGTPRVPAAGLGSVVVVDSVGQVLKSGLPDEVVG
jgi:hypothetical protein